MILTRRVLLQRACMAGAFVAVAPMFAEGQAAERGLTPAQQGIHFANEFASPNWKPSFSFGPAERNRVGAVRRHNPRR